MNASTSAFTQITRRFALPHYLWYLLGTVSLALTTWISIRIPHLSKNIVNSLLSLSQDQHSAIQTAFFIMTLGVLLVLSRSLSRISMFWPGRKIEAEVKQYYFSHILHLPLKSLHKFTHGDLISRLANDVIQLRVFYAFAVLQLLNFSFLALFSIWNMLSVSVELTLLSLLPLLILIIATRFTSPWFHTFSRDQSIRLGDLTNIVTETFANVHIIQTNNAVDSFLSHIEAMSTKVYKANIKLAMIRTFIFPLAGLFSGFSYLLILYFGGQAVIAKTLTVGDILAFNIYIGLLSFPLTALGFILSMYQRAKAASERLVELESYPQETQSSTVIKPLPEKILPLLELKHLHFSYAENQEPTILHDISLSLQPGQILGIIGPVGSGKSTLFHLLTRLYDPPSGTVFFKGRDIIDIPCTELRSQIHYGLQSPYLFSDSILGNLNLGFMNPPSDEAIEQVLNEVSMKGEVDKFPQRSLTPVGEKGVKLSGGQKQRVALARLFLRSCEILLLDDTTASVDFHTERRLLTEIKKKGAAMILISHREYVLEACDEVLVLEQGRITARGRLNEVKILKKEFFYA